MVFDEFFFFEGLKLCLSGGGGVFKGLYLKLGVLNVMMLFIVVNCV